MKRILSALAGLLFATSALAQTPAVPLGPVGSSGGGGGSSLTVGTTPTSGGAAGQVMYDTGSALQESANLTYSAGILSIGASGTLGGVKLGNATSGTLTLEPTTGALGTVTATFPANSGMVAELNLNQTWTQSATFSNGNVTVTAGYVSSLQYIVNELGTKPTLTTGSCSGSSAAGGNEAGSFTAALCSAGTYTLSGLYAAPTGYTCDAQDETTPADTLKQTANTATSVTFLSTTAANDVIVFKCMAW